MELSYDLAIIGSGAAAFAAAIEARRLGGQVIVVERGTVGGTCVNVGCVPSKTLLAAAEAYHTAAAHPFAGVPTSAGAVGMAALIAQKNELVAQMRQHKYVDLAESHGFEIVSGEARFTGPCNLDVAGRDIRAAAYLIATGADPAIPAIPGLRDAGYLTSTTAMELAAVPRRLVTIGGGFVGLEQSQLFARLGADVTIVGRVAPRAEPELASRLREILLDEGITIVNARATAVTSQDGVTTVRTSTGQTAEGDAVLVAAGRHARLDGLDHAAAGIGLDDNGFIKIDDTLRTTSPGVFAAGDVTGGAQFVYVAAAQGRLAARNALSGSHDTIDYRGLPDVIFTSPQLASAGLTEAQALAAGHQCDCHLLGLDNVPRAIVSHDTRGAIKVVADARTGKVLGVHALAHGAGDLILAGVYAIKFGLTIDDLASTWAPYLTMSEALKLAAQSFTTPVDQLSCCAV